MTKAINQITTEELFTTHKEKLDLDWISGRHGANQLIVPETVSPETAKSGAGEAPSKSGKHQKKKSGAPDGKSLVGYLNLIHPHQIQILGNMEIHYLESLRSISRQDALKRLFKSKPACIIIADGCEVPATLIQKSNEKSVPLLRSSLSSTKLTDTLHYYLANLFSDVLTLHGVYMEVMATGVLITGPSGIGKSELALELISRGHRLIADDAPQFSRLPPDIINGTCPPGLRDFLEVRGLGIINVREIFGDSAIIKSKYLKLIIQLQPMDDEHLQEIDRLEGTYRTQKILDIDIPEITLPVAPGRNLAILVECAARNHLLRISGYNASEIFARRQQRQIEQGESR
ncbi:MAG: HPr(Ser) kinase/phosphatase [Gammaproteobacteria bacterium RBG_16_51_14]|nr:MAG: HPr(Ser) kinase/phosphatase [Gammaproteobacteria bacterium RBG_16_51_14]